MSVFKQPAFLLACVIVSAWAGWLLREVTT